MRAKIAAAVVAGALTAAAAGAGVGYAAGHAQAAPTSSTTTSVTPTPSASGGELAQLSSRVDALKAELEQRTAPAGDGGTLRDDVRDLHDSLGQLGDRLDKLEQAVDAIARGCAVLERNAGSYAGACAAAWHGLGSP